MDPTEEEDIVRPDYSTVKNRTAFEVLKRPIFYVRQLSSPKPPESEV